jgi:hypothetical protein
VASEIHRTTASKGSVVRVCIQLPHFVTKREKLREGKHPSQAHRIAEWWDEEEPRLQILREIGLLVLILAKIDLCLFLMLLPHSPAKGSISLFLSSRTIYSVVSDGGRAGPWCSPLT